MSREYNYGSMSKSNMESLDVAFMEILDKRIEGESVEDYKKRIEEKHFNKVVSSNIKKNSNYTKPKRRFRKKK